MTTKLIECYDVQQWDGGDRTTHVGYIVNESDAKDIAGMHGHTHKVKIIIHDNKQDFKDFRDGEVKRQALAKLTDLEIAALGIKL